MNSTMKIQLVVLGVFCLALTAHCQATEEKPMGVAQRTLDGSVRCPKNDASKCPKDSECIKEECVCKEKYYPLLPDRRTCTDKPQDAKSLAAAQEKRELKVNCPTSSPTCPAHSLCKSNVCICDEGYIGNDEKKECIAGGMRALGMSALPLLLIAFATSFFKLV